MTVKLTNATSIGGTVFAVDSAITLPGDGEGALLASGAAARPTSSVWPVPPLPSVGNIGTRIPDGRLASFTNDATGQTFHTVLTVEKPADRIRVILANSQTTGTQTVGAVKVCPLASLASDALINNSDGANGTWVSVTRNGASSWVQDVAQSANVMRLQVTDWVNCSSADRVDGGAFHAYAVRVYYAAATTAFTVVGNGTDDYTNWATRTDGRRWINRTKIGAHVATLTGFDSTTNISQTPVYGIQYETRGEIVTVWLVGDSNISGRGTYLGAGFGYAATTALSSQTGLAVECANIGWAGANAIQNAIHAINILQNDTWQAAKFAGAGGTIGVANADFLTLGTPDVIVYQPWTSNSVSGATIATSEVDTMRQYMAAVVGAARLSGAYPVLVTALPINSSIKAYASTDNLRRLFNWNMQSWYRSTPVVDIAQPVSGAMTAAGQVEFASGMTTDGTHLNDTGIALAAVPLRDLLRRILGPWM